MLKSRIHGGTAPWCPLPRYAAYGRSFLSYRDYSGGGVKRPLPVKRGLKWPTSQNALEKAVNGSEG